MTATFETFKPRNPIVARYVDYYYLDVKPANLITEFECFPHHNNTISLYKCHRRSDNGDMIYDEQAESFQIFTPIREKVLSVRQVGKVHRIVIVFHVLGIQQFYAHQDFSDYVTSYQFLDKRELDQIFNTTDLQKLTAFLDHCLLKRYRNNSHELLNHAIQHIFEHHEDFLVNGLANELRISRRHLNRLFKIRLGVSTKKFHEIVLLRKILEKKLFTNPKETFTRLAYELNYSDQAHLNKSFKNLTQNSPNQFFKKGTLLGDQDTFWHILK